MKKKIMVFCRDYLIPDFQDIVKPHDAAIDFHFLTDGTWPGIDDTKQRFYARLDTASQPAGWTDADEDDAVTRCRLLGNMPRNKALKMLRSMASVLDEELERINPDMVFAQMVDEYITYILAELARRRGIKYIGVCYSYFPGNMLVTEYWNGAPHISRLVSEEEAREVLEIIGENNFRQDYLQKNTYTWGKHAMAVLRYRLKTLVFPVLARLKNDPLNVHYNCLLYVVERRRLSDLPRENMFHQDWRDRLHKAVSANKKPIIYLPLGYYPESTTNYWIENKRILNYMNMVLEICRCLTPHFNVLVKEHLHMLGGRDPGLYEEINKISGAINVPPAEYSHEALNLADAVVIGGGSIGVEAFVRGKPIATFCSTSYWFEPAGAAFLDLSNITDWPNQLTALITNHPLTTDERKVSFIKQCLASTLRVERRGKVWPIPVVDDAAKLFNN